MPQSGSCFSRVATTLGIPVRPWGSLWWRKRKARTVTLETHKYRTLRPQEHHGPGYPRVWRWGKWPANLLLSPDHILGGTEAQKKSVYALVLREWVSQR